MGFVRYRYGFGNKITNVSIIDVILFIHIKKYIHPETQVCMLAFKGGIHGSGGGK
jgi:hypothetical protein